MQTDIEHEISSLRSLLLLQPVKALEKAEELYELTLQYADFTAQSKLLSIILYVHATNRNVSKKVKHFVVQAERLLKKNIPAIQKAEMHSRLVPYYTIIASIEKAKEHIRSAIEQYGKLGNIPSSVLLTGAHMYLEVEEFHEAWALLFQAEEQLVHEKNSLRADTPEAQQRACFSNCAYCCLLTARFYHFFDDYYMMEKYAQEILVYSPQNQFSPNILNALGCLFDAALVQKNYERLREIIAEYQSIATTQKYFFAALQAEKGMAILAKEQREYDKALLFAEQAYELACKHGDRYMRAHPTLLFAELLILTNKNNDRVKILLDEYRDALPKVNTGITHKKYWYVVGLWAKKENDIHTLGQALEELYKIDDSSRIRKLRGEFMEAKSRQKNNLLNVKMNTTHQSPDKYQPSEKANATISQGTKFSSSDILQAVRSTITDLSTQMYELNERTAQKKLQALSHILDEHIREPEMLKTIQHEIHSVHNDYLLQLASRFPALTHTELRIAVFLRLNLNTHQIAALMSISPDTVYSHRKNIRKKVGINHRKSLNMFLLTLEN